MQWGSFKKIMGWQGKEFNALKSNRSICASCELLRMVSIQARAKNCFFLDNN
jgi:hypothetical protein